MVVVQVNEGSEGWGKLAGHREKGDSPQHRLVGVESFGLGRQDEERGGSEQWCLEQSPPALHASEGFLHAGQTAGEQAIDDRRDLRCHSGSYSWPFFSCPREGL